MKARERGIRRTSSGWQVYVRINGEFRSKHFPPDAALVTMREWRETQKARHTLQLPTVTSDAKGLGYDAEMYLELVSGMTTFTNRARMIRSWVKALGADTPRAEITPLKIKRALEQYRKGGDSHGTLNLRRTALMHLFTLLDGKSAPNPVRDVPRFQEPEPRWQLPTVEEAARAIEKSGQTVLTPSRVRLECLLWTGWPPKQLQQMRPERLDLKHATARVPGRSKGAGTADVRLPLLPQAVTALKRFVQIEGWGEWSGTALRTALHRGCRKAKVKRFRVYDLRHVFGTLVASIVKDDRVVAELLQHRTLQMTRRYTLHSVNPRVLEGIAAVKKRLG